MHLFLRLILITFLALLISVRNDGFFPFTAQTNETLMIITSTLHVFAFFIILYLFLFPRKLSEKLTRYLAKVDWLLKTFIIITVTTFNLLICFLLIKIDHNYQEFYSLNLKVLIIVTVLATLGLLLTILFEKAKLSLLILILSGVVLSAIPILYFPITAKIGDLMPIIQEQAGALARGESIYQYFILDNGVATQAVRQPGMALLYLPAHLLNIDFRIMSILFLLITLFYLIKFVYKTLSDIRFDTKFLTFFAATMLFILLPYRVIRMDLYEYPFWALLTAALYMLKTKRYLLFALIWGVGIFTQVWFWLFTPFVLIYIFKQLNLIQALKNSLIIGTIGGGGILVLTLNSFNAYLEHAFGFYRNVVAKGEIVIQSFYLTPLFVKFGLKTLLTPLQGISVGLLSIAALKRLHSFRSFMAFLTLAYFFFIQFNSLTWNYFYINLLFLMIIFLLVEIPATSE